MLQFFHRFQKHVLFIVLLLAIVMAMSGFGMKLGKLGGRSTDSRAAIQVNEIEISHEQVREAIRSTEYRYRQMFGKSYDQFAKQISQNLPQQVSDQLIDQSVVLSEARRLGFVSGKMGIAQSIRRNFPNDPNFALYQSYLAQINKSAPEFESTLADEVVRTQFQDLIKDSVTPSRKEIETSVIRQNTSYTVASVEFDPQVELAKVEAPSDQQIQTYYEDHAAEYELPARVNYKYIAFDAQDFLKSVAVDADTIAIEYDEHKSKYQAPEEYKVRHIQLNYSEKSDPKQMADLKERAKRALDRIKAGESFEKIAEEYSDDITTRNLGGDLGWIQKGKIGPEFDEALSKLKKGELSDLVSADYGFHIIKLDDIHTKRQLTLEETKDQVEKEIREREAPAYTAEHAHVLLDEWKASGKSLDEFAKSRSLSIKESSGLVSKESDPEASLVGMTAKVLEMPDDLKAFVIESGKNSALVEIEERKGNEIPTLDIVKTKIVDKLKLESAKNSAKQRAQQFLEEANSAPLVDIAKTKGLNAVSADYSPQKPGSGVLGVAEVGHAIMSVTKPQTTLSQVYQSGPKFYVVQVASIKTPKLEELKEQLKQADAQEQQAATELLQESILAGLKAKAQIKNNV